MTKTVKRDRQFSSSKMLLDTTGLAEVREARGISRYMLQNYLRFRHPYVQQVEAGRVKVNIPRLAAICVALGCQPEELVKLNFEAVKDQMAELRKKGLTSISERDIIKS